MTQKTPDTWTEPYFGIQHLRPFSTRSTWFTVKDSGNSAELLTWFPGCGFSPASETFDSAEDARAHAENSLQSLGSTP